MQKPWVAALANILLPGTGNLLLGKRIVFGILLMLGVVISQIQLWIDPLPNIYIYGSTAFSAAFGALGFGLTLLAFGCDAYTLAKEKNGYPVDAEMAYHQFTDMALHLNILHRAR